MASCTPCIRSSNSSIRPTSSIKKFLHRQLFKQSSNLTKSRTQSNARFQRIKGTNFVREVNPIAECSYKTTNNSDMTLFHDDITSFYDETQFILFQDDTQITLFDLQPEETPDWASKTQIQIASINQVYFNDKNPDDIFGSVKLNSARAMVQELDLYSSPSLPPNFV